MQHRRASVSQSWSPLWDWSKGDLAMLPRCHGVVDVVLEDLWGALPYRR